jgi:hypothetical protein
MPSTSTPASSGGPLFSNTNMQNLEISKLGITYKDKECNLKKILDEFQQ